METLFFYNTTIQVITSSFMPPASFFRPLAFSSKAKPGDILGITRQALLPKGDIPDIFSKTTTIIQTPEGIQSTPLKDSLSPQAYQGLKNSASFQHLDKYCQHAGVYVQPTHPMTILKGCLLTTLHDQIYCLLPYDITRHDYFQIIKNVEFIMPFWLKE